MLEANTMQIRRSQDRGLANFNWLKSRHTFSFGQYHDPSHMGFGSLRVINEDRVIPGEGFATHSHQNMEIITYVIRGALEHKDSIGNGSIIQPGDIQRMSAGTGISHSEYNASQTDPVHFLQIWVTPDTVGLTPSYEQKHFSHAQCHNHLQLVGSRDGRDGSVVIHQDVALYAATLEQNHQLSYPLSPERQAWIQVISGHIQINGEPLQAGDGVAITESTSEINLSGSEEHSELLLFDLPQE